MRNLSKDAGGRRLEKGRMGVRQTSGVSWRQRTYSSNPGMRRRAVLDSSTKEKEKINMRIFSEYNPFFDRCEGRRRKKYSFEVSGHGHDEKGAYSVRAFEIQLQVLPEILMSLYTHL